MSQFGVMKFPGKEFLWFDEIDSTQDFLAARVVAGDQSCPVVMTGRQTKGRGRFGRKWLDEEGKSLLVSVALWEYANHPEPWLLGMNIAAAAACAFGTQLRWPNDITLRSLKVGGVLTEIHQAPGLGAVPVVGIGINLRQEEFPPEISEISTSLKLGTGRTWTVEAAWEALHSSIRTMPAPTSWECLAPVWALFDDTPGKKYTLADGRPAVAIGIGPGGQLIAAVEGETFSVMAADAHFGTTP